MVLTGAFLIFMYSYASLSDLFSSKIFEKHHLKAVLSTFKSTMSNSSAMVLIIPCWLESLMQVYSFWQRLVAQRSVAPCLSSVEKKLIYRYIGLDLMGQVILISRQSILSEFNYNDHILLIPN